MTNIRRSIHFLLIILLPLFAGAQEVYKTVDKEGNVTYQDTPGKDSEAVDVPTTNQMPGLGGAKSADEDDQRPAEQTARLAYKIFLKEPPEGARIGPGIRSLTLEAELNQALAENHFLIFYRNGAAIDQPTQDTRITLAVNLKMRGKSRFHVDVVDRWGTVLARSSVREVWIIRPPVKAREG